MSAGLPLGYTLLRADQGDTGTLGAWESATRPPGHPAGAGLIAFDLGLPYLQVPPS